MIKSIDFSRRYIYNYFIYYGYKTLQNSYLLILKRFIVLVNVEFLNCNVNLEIYNTFSKKVRRLLVCLPIKNRLNIYEVIRLRRAGKISGKSQCSGYFNSVAHHYIITQIRKSKTKP